MATVEGFIRNNKCYVRTLMDYNLVELGGGVPTGCGLLPHRDHQPVAHGQDGGLEARVGGHPLVEAVDVRRELAGPRRIQHAPAPEGVVRDKQAAPADKPRSLLHVVAVPLLVGVQEDRVEGWVRVERGHQVESVPDADFDPVCQAGIRQRPARDRGAIRVDLEREKLAVPGECACDPHRRIARQGADLENAAGSAGPQQDLDGSGGGGGELDLRQGRLVGAGAYRAQAVVLPGEEAAYVTVECTAIER